jgi:release factor glutamine methyltransferase
MKSGDAVRDAGRRLSLAGVDSPRRSGRLLLAKAMGKATPPSDVEVVAPDVRARLEELVERRATHEPLAYILGHKEFWSLDFLVGPGVLVPRPETETLIEELLKEFPDRARALKILDYGTGSGCLIVAALFMFQNARGSGIDASADALSWARKNVARHGLEARCELQRSDWACEPAFKYDAILANPPYIRHSAMAALPPDVVRYEPVTSLDGGDDGLCAFRKLAPQVAKALKTRGVAFLEIGEGQGESVRTILAAAGLETRRIVPDLAGIPRCVVAGLPK